MIFETFNTNCPFCGRERDVKVSHLLPRMVFDCPRCKSTLEVRLIRQTKKFKTWACEWTVAGVGV